MATQAIQQETAEDESPRKAALRLVKFHTPPTLNDKARRQDLKRQQQPMNQIQAVTEEDEQISYSDEDINQGFRYSHDFHPLEQTRAPHNSQLTRLLTTIQ